MTLNSSPASRCTSASSVGDLLGHLPADRLQLLDVDGDAGDLHLCEHVHERLLDLHVELLGAGVGEGAAAATTEGWR